MVFDRLISAIPGTGFDSTGMGQWTWAQLQGKYNKITTISTA